MTPADRSILQKAEDTINGPRQEQYGDPKNGFENIADQWNLYIYQKYGVTVQLGPEDICWMMADYKKIRQMKSSKEDNVLDAIGYLALIERVTKLK